jgi:Ni,Fe-hydrogenase I large subunit
MKKDEAQVLAEYLYATASVYGRELTKEVIKIYLSVFKDYPFESIKNAIERCILTKETFPVPATIIKELNNKGDLISSELAWSYVLDVIDVCGIYESFTFKDKAIRKAISLIDYDIELCMCNRAETHWKKRDFIESYKVFAESNGNYDAPNYFSGIIEINNEKWEDFKGKIYIAELKQFVKQEDIIKLIDGYKPKLSLVDRKPKNQIAGVKINA